MGAKNICSVHISMGYVCIYSSQKYFLKQIYTLFSNPRQYLFVWEHLRRYTVHQVTNVFVLKETE